MAEQTTTEVHRCYDVSFKLRAIEVAEKESKASAARQLKVAPKRIREWCAQKDKLIEMKKSGKSKCKG